MIYIGALLKSLAGVMKLAVNTGHSSPTKASAPLGGVDQHGLKAATEECAVCALNIVFLWMAHWG